jgi:omega-hydroxy-beta-dihydromenaquinone-9 sulfotransferase
MNPSKGGCRRLDVGIEAYQRLQQRWHSQIPWRTGLEMSLVSRWLSGISSLQRAIFRDRLNRLVIKSPLFIVGHWRSGTSLLHELLCLDPRFTFPSTQACLHPHYALFARQPPAPARAVRRPMDDMLVTVSTPQEDEFALFCLGAPSPYEAFLFPQGLLNLLTRSDPRFLSNSEKRDWDRVFGDFLKIVTLLGNGRRMVLKSPPHSMRIPTLLRLFPEAQFIHIVRHPATVYSSSIHMFRKMMTLYGIGTPIDDTRINEVLVQSIPRLESAIVDSVQGLPPGQYVCLSFESLIANPLRALEKIYDVLALNDFATQKERLINNLAARAGYRPNTYALSAGDSERLGESCKLLMRKYGYSF